MARDAAQQFVDAVALRAEGSGYEVTRTRTGFRIERDLSDESHWEPLFRAGIEKLIRHDVHLDEATRRVTIVDEVRDVVWTGGAEPRPAWSGGKARRRRGRVIERGFAFTYDPSADGPARMIEQYRYDTNEGRRFVRDVAKELGWREQRSIEQKIGIAVAVLGGVGALITGIVLLVMSLGDS